MSRNCDSPRADHPRIRGEHEQSRHEKELVPRIIPAYAGSTPTSPTDSPIMMDHPRIRGEHRKGGKSLTINKGSSPHTRGAPPFTFRDGITYGIIPAYAGSTRRRTAPSWRPRDHPRIRGEHAPARRRRPYLLGSSPHTRGARGGNVQVPAPPRIIPAYAGSTSPPFGCGFPSRDHPRIRGEHELFGGGADIVGGSSPHTRGARIRPAGSIRPARIIPAYAGSTVAEQCTHWVSSDHPRIRGEHEAPRDGDAESIGSSPHTRGAPFGTHRVPVDVRDHPRIRGEHKLDGNGPKNA